MITLRCVPALLIALAASLLVSRSLRAEIHVMSAPVPPTLEIEILDPGVDPRGNPAVVLHDDGSGATTQVDIPPVVLVHRYYYTGDRTFQGPMLPGGPSIIVANHPRTGERCYIDAQMLPGAPKVSYSSCKIEYDYGPSGITLWFPRWSAPYIQYRSGTKWSDKAAKFVHAEAVHSKWQDFHECAQDKVARTKTVTCGLFAATGDAVKFAARPVANVLTVVPLGNMLVSDQFEENLSQRAFEHQQEHDNRKFEAEAQRQEQSFRTNR